MRSGVALGKSQGLCPAFGQPVPPDCYRSDSGARWRTDKYADANDALIWQKAYTAPLLTPSITH